MDIVDRLNEIIVAEELSVAAFARRAGLGDQTLRGIVVQRRNKPGFDVLAKIVDAFPYVNAEWLLTGRGVMIKVPSSVKPETDRLKIELLRYIKDRDEQINQLMQENLRLRSELTSRCPNAGEAE